LRTYRFIFCFGIVLLLAGCGGVSSKTPAPTPTPTPTPMPSPSPTPAPSPSPTPSPTPTPAASDAFLTTMFREAGRNPDPVGTVTLDLASTNGAGNIQLTNIGENNTTQILQFCPYPEGFSNCINVTQLTTDAGGNANVNFTFPQKGTFSGGFQLVELNGAQFGATATGSSGVSFKSALLPAATVTGGIQQTSGNPPGIGNVVVSGTTAHIVLTGTMPNHTFSTAVCSLTLQTPCAPLADITTNAQGNASADVGTVQPAGWSIFRLSDAVGVEFVTAFRVQ
jgi:hypothetical protein